MVHAALEGTPSAPRIAPSALPARAGGVPRDEPHPDQEAMAMTGMIEPSSGCRCAGMSDANRETLRGVLKQYGLVK